MPYHEWRAFHNLGNTISRDTAGRTFQHGGEEKTEVTDLCSLGKAEAAGNVNLKQIRVKNKKQKGQKRGLIPKRKSSFSFQQIFEEVLANEKTKD